MLTDEQRWERVLHGYVASVDTLSKVLAKANESRGKGQIRVETLTDFYEEEDATLEKIYYIHQNEDGDEIKRYDLSDLIYPGDDYDAHYKRVLRIADFLHEEIKRRYPDIQLTFVNPLASYQE